MSVRSARSTSCFRIAKISPRRSAIQSAVAHQRSPLAPETLESHRRAPGPPADAPMTVGDQTPGMDAVRPKPLLRGVSHQIALTFAVTGAAGLISLAQGARATAVTVVYGASLTGLFGISALYHRPTWPPRALVWLRRLDHSMIFVFIAASASTIMTPIPGSLGVLARSLAWGAAVVGIARAVLWPRAPRWVASSLYIAFGWMIVPFLGALHGAIGVSGLLQLFGGGLLYTAGAVVYALRRPDPAPRVFGYHEVFHLLVIAAAAIHFALVARLVTTSALG